MNDVAFRKIHMYEQWMTDLTLYEGPIYYQCLRKVPSNTEVYDYTRKADLSKSY